MSCVTCHVSHVTCHVSHLFLFFIFFLFYLFFFFFGQSGGAYRWRVCHQRGYPVQFPKHRPSGPMLSISLNVRLSVCVCLCLFTFEIPFKRLFAPISQSRMSNIFRVSKSLGKSNTKKWSQIRTFLFENCRKSPRKKKFFFADFALQNMVETMLPDGLETSGRTAYR